jgi:hypothetical protein
MDEIKDLRDGAWSERQALWKQRAVHVTVNAVADGRQLFSAYMFKISGLEVRFRRTFPGYPVMLLDWSDWTLRLNQYVVGKFLQSGEYIYRPALDDRWRIARIDVDCTSRGLQWWKVVRPFDAWSVPAMRPPPVYRGTLVYLKKAVKEFFVALLCSLNRHRMPCCVVLMALLPRLSSKDLQQLSWASPCDFN